MITTLLFNTYWQYYELKLWKLVGNGISTTFSLIHTLCDLYKGYEQSQDGSKIQKIAKKDFHETDTTKFDSFLL